MQAQLSIGNDAVASGRCVAAFAQSAEQTQVYVVVDNPLEAATLLVDAAKAVGAGLLARGVSPEKLDILLGAVALALAGPPEELALPESGSKATVAVEVLEGGQVLDRVEGTLALCAILHQGGVGVFMNAPRQALVPLAKALVAAVSLELGGEGADARRAALLREVTHAALDPEGCTKLKAVREYP